MTRARRSCRGFTLFEVILVLVLLLAAMAMAWPAMARMSANQRLQQGAELVQIRMMSARVHALDSGLAYQFRFEPGGRRFVVVPFEHDPTVAGAAQQIVVKHAGQLPPAVQFEGSSGSGHGGQEISDELLAGLPDIGNYSGVSWSPPILFYSDGTAMPVLLTVRDSKHAMRVAIRAMTGGVTIFKVE